MKRLLTGILLAFFEAYILGRTLGMSPIGQLIMAVHGLLLPFSPFASAAITLLSTTMVSVFSTLVQLKYIGVGVIPYHVALYYIDIPSRDSMKLFMLGLGTLTAAAIGSIIGDFLRKRYEV